MNSHRIEKFLEEVVSHVKFTLDHNEIRLELKHHMIDKIEHYMEKGYDKKDAEDCTIKDMGDPEIIGLELNKQHSPLIGWVWKITNFIVILLIIINSFMVVPMILVSIFRTSGVNRIPKENIEYRLDINEKVQIDDRVIRFTNIVYEKNGNMNIFYRDYEKKFLRGGWSLGYVGDIKDDLGNKYPNSGSSSGGIVTKSRITMKDFPENAKNIVVDYDLYNRKYRVEVPLRTGEDNE